MTQQELRIGRCTLMAGLLWLTSIGAAVFMTIQPGSSLELALWAVISLAGAVVLTVRCFLVHQSTMMRDAYLIGRDAREFGLVEMIPRQRSG